VFEQRVEPRVGCIARVERSWQSHHAWLRGALYLQWQYVIGFQLPVACLQPLGLIRAELLQLANLAPMTEVEVHLIVEDCEQRLADGRMDVLLSLVAKYFGNGHQAQGHH